MEAISENVCLLFDSSENSYFRRSVKSLSDSLGHLICIHPDFTCLLSVQEDLLLVTTEIKKGESSKGSKRIRAVQILFFRGRTTM